MDCFIIMPISTPETALAQYAGDKDHFKHVLDHLFVPAVEQAGMNAIPPTAKGADIIQGEIVKHLGSADLVLCDMSTLNANVFFELGIRTALNKPVALVRDTATPNIPFDTQIINYHIYSSSLALWTVDSEVKKIEQHLRECAERSDAGNTLWRYFGLSSEATPLQAEPGLEGKVDFLTMQMEALRREVGPYALAVRAMEIEPRVVDPQELHDRIVRELDKHGIVVRRAEYDIGQLRLLTSEAVPDAIRQMLTDYAAAQGIALSWSTKTLGKQS